jgi:hypothetical protein
MTMEVFFNRPGESTIIFDRICSDIKNSQERIFLAMAYCNDEDILDAIKNTYADVKKKVVIYKGCFDRKAIEKTISHYTVYLGETEFKEKDNKSTDKSIMHNKFLIIDNILWVGSYNFTATAKTVHWENMMRITEKSIIDQYLTEFNYLFRFGYINYVTQNSDEYAHTSLYRIETKDKKQTTFCNHCNKSVGLDIRKHYFFTIENKCITKKSGNMVDEYGTIGYKRNFVHEDSWLRDYDDQLEILESNIKQCLRLGKTETSHKHQLELEEAIKKKDQYIEENYPEPSVNQLPVVKKLLPVVCINSSDQRINEIKLCSICHKAKKIWQLILIKDEFITKEFVKNPSSFSSEELRELFQYDAESELHYYIETIETTERYICEECIEKHH